MLPGYDPSLIGKVFEVTEPLAVTVESIRSFCAALGEDNPLYNKENDDALIAPPSFAVTCCNSEQFWKATPPFGYGFDAGKEVEFVRPIRAGDRLTISTTIREIYEKTGRSGAMLFMVLRSTLTNQHGETVAHVDHRFAHHDPPPGKP